jgi:hypothetical protein
MALIFLFQILPLIIATGAVKVPVEYKEEPKFVDSDSILEQSEKKPIYYTPDETRVDSYLIPPDPHKPEEVLPDTVITPATYLLPPSANEEPANYYAPTEAGEQSEWYPIAQTQSNDQQISLLPLRVPNIPLPIYNQSTTFKTIQYPRDGKAINIPIPSLKLEPPAQNAPNEYIIKAPSEELELPAEEIDEPYKSYGHNSEPSIVSHLTPPKHLYKHKNPTKLYPKKFHGAFKPVPIPVSPFAEGSLFEVPKAKPAKYFQPLPGVENPILLPIDEKKLYQFQQAEKKRKRKEDNDEPYVSYYEYYLCDIL